MFQSAPILLGQYRPLDSYLHRLDARAKLLPVLAVMIFGLMTNSFAFYMVLMGVLIGGLLWSGTGVRALARNFRPILIMVAITFLYHLIFSARDSETVATILGFSITEGGLSGGAFYSLRLALFVAIAFLITLTNSPSELAEAIVKLLRPLRRLRLPADDLGLILFIAIRFIPILYEEFGTIRNAQVIRGVDFSGGLLNRMRKTSYILIPVLVAAIGRADDLAQAMEARGYRSGQPRTFYSRSTFGPAAWTFMIGASAGVALLYWVTK